MVRCPDHQRVVQEPGGPKCPDHLNQVSVRGSLEVGVEVDVGALHLPGREVAEAGIHDAKELALHARLGQEAFVHGPGYFDVPMQPGVGIPRIDVVVRVEKDVVRVDQGHNQTEGLLVAGVQM
jgi:hypothetical protein